MKGRKPTLKVPSGGTPTGRPPSAPRWFSTAAADEWRRTAPMIHSRGHLADDTRATFESYCVAVGTIRETEEAMVAEGRLVETKDGLKPHPASKVQATAMREARLLAAELGLTPHRRKAGGEETETVDDWDSDLLA